MAQSKGNKGNSNKGFGSMDEGRQKEIARQGGRASAQSNTSNRGFASMDKGKQREISSQGGRASQASSSGRAPRGATGRNEQATSQQSSQHEDINRNELDHADDMTSGTDLAERDLNSLEEEDEVASRRGQASYSETDEDEDEGLGDGNIGRSARSRGLDEEG